MYDCMHKCMYIHVQQLPCRPACLEGFGRMYVLLYVSDVWLLVSTMQLLVSSKQFFHNSQTPEKTPQNTMQLAMSVCMYVCMYICRYVCMYVHTYACVYMHLLFNMHLLDRNMWLLVSNIHFSIFYNSQTPENNFTKHVHMYVHM